MTPPRVTMPLLKFAAFAEGTATVMLLIFVPYHARAGLGEGSFLLLSLIVSLPALSIVPAANFWGGLSDVTGRYGRVTAVCLSGFFFALALIPLLGDTLSVIAVIFLLSFLYGAVRPLLLSQSTLLSEEAKSWAISGIFFYESLGYFSGGCLHGVLFDPLRYWTEWILFPLPGLLCLAAAAAAANKDRGPSLTRHPARPHFRKALMQDLAEVYRHPVLRRLACVVLLASTANFCFFGMYAVFFTERFNVPQESMSLTLSLSTLVGMAVFPLAGRCVGKAGGRTVLAATIIAWIANYGAYQVIRAPWLACANFVVPIYPFFLVSTNALAAEASRSARRGGGLGALGGIAALSTATGAVLGGALADLMGLKALPAAAALGHCAALAALALLGRMEGYGNTGTPVEGDLP